MGQHILAIKFANELDITDSPTNNGREERQETRSGQRKAWKTQKKCVEIRKISQGTQRWYDCTTRQYELRTGNRNEVSGQTSKNEQECNKEEASWCLSPSGMKC